MVGGDVSLNVNFALSKPLLGADAVLSRIVSYAAFTYLIMQGTEVGRIGGTHPW